MKKLHHLAMIYQYTVISLTKNENLKDIVMYMI